MVVIMGIKNPLIVATILSVSIFSLSVILSKGVETQKTVTPRLGVECFVVARLFSVSTDCWSV